MYKIEKNPKPHVWKRPANKAQNTELLISRFSLSHSLSNDNTHL